MKINKISFIEPRAAGANIFSKFPIPRLGAPILATILQQRGYIVKIFVENIAEPDRSFIDESDLVCVSTITPTAPRAYKIAEELKNKGKIVVMGGAHPSFMAEEAMNYCDYVVRKEGDETIMELISYLERGGEIKNIFGLSYRDSRGNIAHNSNRPLLENLNSLPEPNLSLIHNWHKMRVYPVSTSRGCPFNCRFCSVIQMFGRKYRLRSVDKVIQGLKYVKSVSDKSIFFVDDNFAADKSRTKEILRRMINEKINVRWSAQVRTDVAKDPELLDLMANSGCDTLHIGFESINPRTLELYDKKQTVEEIKDCVRIVKNHRLYIDEMFVFGGDTDDMETIDLTADFAVKSGADIVSFYMLTPLPGTPIFEEMKSEERLIHTDWSKYDAHHVVFKPKRMSANELQLKTLEAMGRFYSNKYILKHLLRIVKHLSQFNIRGVKDSIFYSGIGCYGKNAVKKAIKELL